MFVLPALGYTIHVGDPRLPNARDLPPPKPREIELPWETEALMQSDIITDIKQGGLHVQAHPSVLLLHLQTFIYTGKTVNTKHGVLGIGQRVQSGGEAHPRRSRTSPTPR